ncbi:MAG: PIG-L family deacetylase [Bryobacteraceae bacterium]
MRVILLAFTLLALEVNPLAAQPEMPAGELQLRLRKLRVLGSVLMIAAHPDDEDMSLLAYFGKGRLYRTAYLSLTRGEGGQNLIGAEQGALLGVIRTQELLASRRLDGAEQYFSRAIDFGYTKTAEEAITRWGHEQTLSDIVAVIRRYQPDVVVLRFSGTPRDGHGHHQASAMLGKEAYPAAAEAARFPELKLEPWKAVRLLHNTLSFFPYAAVAKPGAVSVDMGEYSPLLGQSFTELGSISRSQHRTQAMGAPLWRGPAIVTFEVRGGTPPQKDPFDGIDTSWIRVPGGAEVDAQLRKALDDYRADEPWRAVPALLRARTLMLASDHPWAKRKLVDSAEVVAACLGLRADLVARSHTVIAASRIDMTATVIQRSPLPVKWTSARIGTEAHSEIIPLHRNRPASRPFQMAVPRTTTQPFWLRSPSRGDGYSIADSALRNRPETPPLVEGDFEIDIDGQPVHLVRPVLFRGVDPVRGEYTRPLAAIPPVGVHILERVLLAADSKPRPVTVEVTAFAPCTGSVRLEAGSGWDIHPAEQPIQLDGPGKQRTLAFSVTPPARTGSTKLHSSASCGAITSGETVNVIQYEHIPAQTVMTPAEARAERLDIRTLARRAGYVMGAGDVVPESLRQLGVEVTVLSDDDLARADLSRFDAIVTGVRAYNVRAGLRANQQRLLDYAERGGTLIVQYNVIEGGPGMRGQTGALDRLGPHPLAVGRGRVSVEEAPVTLLKPDHLLLNAPNRITASDFAGWVQERGLYFASTWDSRYETVFASGDPGEAPLPGGTLYCRYGKGAYIFTAYSWFRQLPAGVPGAYRLFANFLSAGIAARKEAR